MNRATSLDQRHKESDGRMGCPSNNGGVSLGRGSGLNDPRPGSHLWHHRHTSIARHGHSGQANCTSLTLAEWLCRTVDRIDPARVLGPRYCFGRGTSAPDSKIIRRLLQLRQNASVFAQGCAGFSPGSAIWRHKFARHTGRTSSSIRSDLDFRYTQARFPSIERLADAVGVDPAELFTSAIPAGSMNRGAFGEISAKLAPLTQRKIDKLSVNPTLSAELIRS